jgi:hypothetical protein
MDDVGVQKKNRFVKTVMWQFLPICSEKVPTKGIILKAQVVQFNQLLCTNETLQACEGNFGGDRFNIRHDQ